MCSIFLWPYQNPYAPSHQQGHSSIFYDLTKTRIPFLPSLEWNLINSTSPGCHQNSHNLPTFPQQKPLRTPLFYDLPKHTPLFCDHTYSLLYHDLHHVLYHMLPTGLHTTSTRYTKPHTNSRPIKFTIFAEMNIIRINVSNTLPIKKSKSSRAIPILMLDNTVNNNSVFNTKHAEFSANW